MAAQLDDAAPERPLPVIVCYRPGHSPAALAAISRHVQRQLCLDHSLAASLTPAEIRRLAACGAVERIEPDLVCHATRERSQASFGVSQARADFGLNGDGDGAPGHYSPQDHTIAVIDTGIDGSHQDFAGGKILAWKDFVAGREAPYDDNGHGTHVASIAAGGMNGLGVSGVAPAAALVGLKVLSAEGSTSSSTVAQAIEWCIANRQQYGIRVINLSLSASGSSDGTDLLSRTVDRAVAAGIVVCVAAGNDGPGRATISTPAAAAGAITVGNMADVGRGGFALLPHSSRGPTADGRVKPDLCAPGYQILAAKAGSGSDYVTLSGTSMAAPFVAGVAALLLQAEPGLTPAQVKGLLKGTAVGFGGAGENNEYGAGRLDAYAALAQAAKRRGTGPVVPGHVSHGGYLQGTGDFQSWSLRVDDTSFPVATTLIQGGASATFNLEIYGPDGSLLGRANDYGREKLASFRPAAGTYTLVVRSAAGSGDYDLDLSGGAVALPVPAAPAALSARTVNSTQISLTWTDNSADETGFELMRQNGGGAFERIALLGSNATRFADSGLKPDTTYRYRVRAISRGGTSAWSNAVSGTTLPEPPAAPGELSVRAAGPRQMLLQWQDRSTNETAFVIERRSGRGTFAPIALVGANVTSFVDGGLSPNTTYSYHVRAVNRAGVSAWSNDGSAATLSEAPPALSRTKVSPRASSSASAGKKQRAQKRH